jgi:hypothetical protein
MKILFTIIIFIVSVILVVNTTNVNALLSKDKLYIFMTIINWLWLFFGQYLVLIILWEEL